MSISVSDQEVPTIVSTIVDPAIAIAFFLSAYCDATLDVIPHISSDPLFILVTSVIRALACTQPIARRAQHAQLLVAAQRLPGVRVHDVRAFSSARHAKKHTVYFIRRCMYVGGNSQMPDVLKGLPPVP